MIELLFKYKNFKQKYPRVFNSTKWSIFFLESPTVDLLVSYTEDKIFSSSQAVTGQVVLF